MPPTKGSKQAAAKDAKKSLADLIAEVSAESWENAGVLDFLMRRRDDMLIVLSKSVPGSRVFGILQTEGLECTYPHFMRELRRFCIINDLPVRGRIDEAERELANTAQRRYSLMHKAEERLGGRSGGGVASPAGQDGVAAPASKNPAAHGADAARDAARRSLAAPSLAERSSKDL